MLGPGDAYRYVSSVRASESALQTRVELANRIQHTLHRFGRKNISDSYGKPCGQRGLRAIRQPGDLYAVQTRAHEGKALGPTPKEFQLPQRRDALRVILVQVLARLRQLLGQLCKMSRDVLLVFLLMGLYDLRHSLLKIALIRFQCRNSRFKLCKLTVDGLSVTLRLQFPEVQPENFKVSIDFVLLLADLFELSHMFLNAGRSVYRVSPIDFFLDLLDSTRIAPFLRGPQLVIEELIRGMGLVQRYLQLVSQLLARVLLERDANLLRFTRAPMRELPLQYGLQCYLPQFRRSAEHPRIRYVAGLIERRFQRHGPLNPIFVGSFGIGHTVAV